MAKKKSRTSGLGSNLLESLSDYVRRIETEVEGKSELRSKPILLSTDVQPRVLKEDLGIKKTPIVWPLYNYKMFYVVEVPAKTTVPRHSHDEDVFRYVVKGSFHINDIEVTEGMWCVVRKGTPYKIVTETGYVVISAYTSVCRTRRGEEIEPPPPRA